LHRRQDAERRDESAEEEEATKSEMKWVRASIACLPMPWEGARVSGELSRSILLSPNDMRKNNEDCCTRANRQRLMRATQQNMKIK
jgi:hypothetical protein